MTANGVWESRTDLKNISLHEALRCDNVYSKQERCSEYLKYDGDTRDAYRWRINKPICEIDSEEFNTDTVCDLLNHQNMMIVGDSLNTELKLSWINAMTLYNYKHHNSTWKCVLCDFSCNDMTSIPCYRHDSTVSHYMNIYDIRNDRVSLINEVREDYLTNFMEKPWLDHLHFIECIADYYEPWCSL
jgi:hypothetical protein